MERYTRETAQGWTLDGADQEAAIARLARFENAYFAIVEQQKELSDRLEALKGQGRQKSAQFRELLGKKLVNQQILLAFEFQGIG